MLLVVGRDSSVGIGSRYGMDGPGSNTCGGEIFSTHPDRPWSTPILTCLEPSHPDRPWNPPILTGTGAQPSRPALEPTRPDRPWNPHILTGPGTHPS